MSDLFWQGALNGSWFSPFWLVAGSNPQVFTVPTAADTATASGSPSGDLTMSFNGSGAASSLSMSFATLNITGGELDLGTGSSLDKVTLSSGVLDFGNSGNTTSFINGGFAQTGGTLSIDTGAVVMSGAISLGGTVSGGGDLVIGGFGVATIEAGAVIQSGTFELAVALNGTTSLTTLDTNFSYSGNFLLDDVSGNNAVLALNGHNFTISGTSTLNGTVTGPGTFTVQGASGVSANNQFIISSGAKLVEAGTMTQTGGVELSANLTVNNGATWDIVTDSGIVNIASATITNNGLFEKTAGSGISSISDNFTNSSTGTLDIETGNIRNIGTMTNHGTITGAGSLTVTGAFTTNGNVTSLNSLTLLGGGTLGGTFTNVGTVVLANGGAYTVSAALNPGKLEIDDFSTVTLNRNERLTGNFVENSGDVGIGAFTLTLNGPSTLSGRVGGTGSLLLKNSTLNGFTAYGTVTVEDTGTVTQTGSIRLGSASTDTVTLKIDSGATYVTAGSSVWIGDPNLSTTGSATIDNFGLFKVTGTGTTQDWTAFTNEAGSTLNVATGSEFAFQRLSTDLAGTVSGGGQVDLNNTWTIEAGTTVSVATLTSDGTGTLNGDLTYGGNFSSFNGSNIAIGNHTLTLSGAASLAGAIGGTGKLVLDNATLNGFTAYGTATVEDAGTVTQTGSIRLGGASTDTVTLKIDSGATYEAGGSSVWIGDPNLNTTGSAMVDNSGLFKVTGTGVTQDWTAFTNEAGSTLDVASGSEFGFQRLTTDLAGTVSGGGQIDLNNTWTIEAGATISVAALTSAGSGTLNEDLDYAGTFSSFIGNNIALNGHTLTLSGTSSLAGFFGGTGSLVLDNATINNFTAYGTATVEDAGSITQTGSIRLGGGVTDTVTLKIDSGATYTVEGNTTWIGDPNLNGTGQATIDNSGLFKVTGTGTTSDWTNFTNEAGATLDIGSGSEFAFQLLVTHLGGTISGAGQIDLNNTWTIESGGVVSVATLANNGSGTLNESLSYAGNLTSSSGSSLALNGHTLTLEGTATLGGAISGAGDLVVDTMGLVTLSATNSFTGGVTLEGGTLQLGAQGAAGTGDITFAANSGATLEFTAAQSPANTIVGFSDGDFIAVTDKTLTGFLYTLGVAGGGTLELDFGDGSHTVLSLLGGYSQDEFSITGNEIIVHNLGVTINGSPNNDVINDTTTVAGQPLPTERNDTINGANGDDVINGLGGDDKINGGGGDDTVEGGAGNDILTGGGNTAVGDTVSYEHALGGVTVSLAVVTAQDTVGAGLDTIGSFENLKGSAFADVLSGNGVNNTLSGLDGNDSLSGGKGDDTLDGGSGDDTLEGGVGNDALIGGANTVAGDTASYEHATGPGTTGVTVSLAIAGQQDTVIAGLDTLSGIENLTGSALDDTLTGSSTRNALTGGAGDDHLFGGAGNDTLNGGSGNDYLDGGTGSDTMTGGAGDDTYIVDSAGDKVNETGASDGVDLVQASVTFVLNGTKVQVENLTLTGGNAIDGTGNALDNHIIGNSADNTLSGLGGNDTIEGGGGNDTLIGGANGAAGDTLSYEHAGSGVTVSLSLTTAQDTGDGSDTISGFENLTGSNSGDTLTGNAGANVLMGLAGNDTLDGLGGNDTMFGGAGDDLYIVDSAGDRAVETSAADGTDTVQSSVSFSLNTTDAQFIENLTLTGTKALTATGNALDNTITGNSGNDTLSGLGGSDTLIGGGGRDTLTGGDGNDTFKFLAASDTGTTNATRDVIADFTVGADKIDLTAIDAVAGGADDAFTFVGANAFSHTAGELRQFTSGANTIVAGDINGDGVSDFEIQLNGHLTLGATSFLL